MEISVNIHKDYSRPYVTSAEVPLVLWRGKAGTWSGSYKSAGNWPISYYGKTWTYKGFLITLNIPKVWEYYFSPTLPDFLSSTVDIIRVMDHEDDETFKQFTNNAADDNAEIYFGPAEDLTANHGILDSPALRSQTFTKFGDAQRPLGFNHVFSISPGSSPKDSSSDSSVQHQSASSSNSSGSRMHRGNIPIAKDYVTAWDAQECTSGLNVEQASSYAGISESGALDSRNPTPEHGFSFGYGSDILTQVGYGDSVSYSPLRHVAMPFRSSPKPSFMARQGRGHRAGASAVSVPFHSIWKIDIQ